MYLYYIIFQKEFSASVEYVYTKKESQSKGMKGGKKYSALLLVIPQCRHSVRGVNDSVGRMVAHQLIRPDLTLAVCHASGPKPSDYWGELCQKLASGAKEICRP